MSQDNGKIEHVFIERTKIEKDAMYYQSLIEVGKSRPLKCEILEMDDEACKALTMTDPKDVATIGQLQGLRLGYGKIISMLQRAQEVMKTYLEKQTADPSTKKENLSQVQIEH